MERPPTNYLEKARRLWYDNIKEVIRMEPATTIGQGLDATDMAGCLQAPALGESHSGPHYERVPGGVPGCASRGHRNQVYRRHARNW